MTKTLKDLGEGYPFAWAQYMEDLEKRMMSVNAKIVNSRKPDPEKD